MRFKANCNIVDKKSEKLKLFDKGKKENVTQAYLGLTATWINLMLLAAKYKSWVEDKVDA